MSEPVPVRYLNVSAWQPADRAILMRLLYQITLDPQTPVRWDDSASTFEDADREWASQVYSGLRTNHPESIVHSPNPEGLAYCGGFGIPKNDRWVYEESCDACDDARRQAMLRARAAANAAKRAAGGRP